MLNAEFNYLRRCGFILGQTCTLLPEPQTVVNRRLVVSTSWPIRSCLIPKFFSHIDWIHVIIDPGPFPKTQVSYLIVFKNGNTSRFQL